MRLRLFDSIAGREGDRISVLFTLWGEALTRLWYSEALIQLKDLSHVERAAAQTNLACGLGWVERCDKSRLAVWATSHPSQMCRGAFLARCRELDRRGERFSVGVVGLKEQLAEALRRELPRHVYLWVNAYKPGLGDLTAEEARRFEAIDPLYPVNTARYPSLGHPCRAGRSVISVDGDGAVLRCQFIREPIASLYGPAFESTLIERPCTKATCTCHIGYVHLDHLGLYPVFRRRRP